MGTVKSDYDNYKSTPYAQGAGAVAREKMAIDLLSEAVRSAKDKWIILLLPKAGEEYSPTLMKALNLLDEKGLHFEGDSTEINGIKIQLSHLGHQRWGDVKVRVRFSVPGLVLNSDNRMQSWSNTVISVPEVKDEWTRGSSLLSSNQDVSDRMIASSLMRFHLQLGMREEQTRYLFSKLLTNKILVVKRPLRGSRKDKKLVIFGASRSQKILNTRPYEEDKMFIALLRNISNAAVYINESRLFFNKDYRDYLGDFDAYAEAAEVLIVANEASEARVELREMREHNEISEEQYQERFEKVRNSFHSVALRSLAIVKYAYALRSLEDSIIAHEKLLESIQEKSEAATKLNQWDAKYSNLLTSNDENYMKGIITDEAREQVESLDAKVQASLNYLKELTARKILPVEA